MLNTTFIAIFATSNIIKFIFRNRSRVARNRVQEEEISFTWEQAVIKGAFVQAIVGNIYYVFRSLKPGLERLNEVGPQLS